MPPYIEPTASAPTEQHARLQWAKEQYLRIQQINHGAGYHRHGELPRPGDKSALFARLMSGKLPLAYPPPISFKQPWYESIEEEGPFDVVMEGPLDSMTVPHGQRHSHYLEYLSINQCPWGVVTGNTAAGHLFDQLLSLRKADRSTGKTIIADIHATLLEQPAWLVKFDPWDEHRLALGRVRRRGRRADLKDVSFFRATFDGTNLVICDVLQDGESQIAGRKERLASLYHKPEHQLSLVEKRALHDISNHEKNPSDLDWVEYECDGWKLFRADNSFPL